MENVTIKKKRGGKREGAGRPPTGRHRMVCYVTEEEENLLREFIQALRKTAYSTLNFLATEFGYKYQKIKEESKENDNNITKETEKECSNT